MKDSSKLQELVSNSVANALATVSNSNKKGTTQSTTVKDSKETTPKKSTKPKPKAKEVTKVEKVIQEVTTQQNAAILEKVISTREVKYIYPEDVTDTLARKRWRQKTRNELHRLEREMFRIKDTNSKEYKEAQKTFEDYKATVLKPAQIA